MKYAICNEVYGDLPFEEAFRQARQCGYEGLEIAPFTLGENIFEISADRRRWVRDLAGQNELQIIGLHWLLAHTQDLHLTSSNLATRARTVDYMAELARLCRDLGGGVMVLGSPQQRNLTAGMSYQEGFDNAVQTLSQLLPVLDETEVTLAIEPLGPEEGDFILTADAGVELVTAVDCERVRLHLDVKAMSTEAKPIPEIIHDSKAWLSHFHANDPNRPGPGMGDLDFLPIVQALKQVQYTGWISVEVFDYTPGLEALTRGSLNYMQGIEQQLEVN